jgi:hypothetical protein
MIATTHRPAGYAASTPFVMDNGATKSVEVTFSAVPEPSVWLLMLGGSGLLAVSMSRRTSRAS